MKWLKRKLRGWLLKDYLKDRVRVFAIQQVITDHLLVSMSPEASSAFLKETFREMAYKIADQMLKEGMFEMERENDQRLLADVIRMKVRIFIPHPFKETLKDTVT